MGAGKSSVRRTFNSHSHRGNVIARSRSSVRTARGLLGWHHYTRCYAINAQRDCVDFDCRYGVGCCGRRARGKLFPGKCLGLRSGSICAGLLCAAFRMERNAYRNAGVTFAIIVLVPRANAAWIIALHRFFEVSLGILIALALVSVWPDRPTRSAKQNAK